MRGRQLLDEIAAKLRDAHAERLQGVVLYGSEARGEARTDVILEAVRRAHPEVFGELPAG